MGPEWRASEGAWLCSCVQSAGQGHTLSSALQPPDSQLCDLHVPLTGLTDNPHVHAALDKRPLIYYFPGTLQHISASEPPTSSVHESGREHLGRRLISDRVPPSQTCGHKEARLEHEGLSEVLSGQMINKIT